MAYDLASTGDDIAYSNARQRFGKEIFNQLYPDWPDVIAPIVPAGTAFLRPASNPQRHQTASSRQASGLSVPVLAPIRITAPTTGPWPPAKRRTARPSWPTTRTCRCRSPIFYEMQLKTPEANFYGVSIPGAPGVIIGFNDHIGWGLTNGYMDVLDYYTMEFRNGKSEYRFNGEWRKADVRVEEIRVKGREPFLDTVAYTVWGPVLYDPGFGGDGFGNGYLAMRWTAHDASNELLSLYKLNRAKDYADYTGALEIWSSPAQNFLFASRTEGIAIWQNGKHPLRWKDQGNS